MSKITLEQYEHELVGIEDAVAHRKPGWGSRLLSRYWKRLLFIGFLLILPGGCFVLAVIGLIWLLNWGSEMNKMCNKKFSAEWERCKKEAGL
jgi:hypothetical protein